MVLRQTEHGQAYPVVTTEGIALHETIVKKCRCVSVNEVASRLDMNHGSAQHMVHEVMQFLKVSTRCVAHHLTAELKEWHGDACREILKCFEAEGDGFL